MKGKIVRYYLQNQTLRQKLPNKFFCQKLPNELFLFVKEYHKTITGELGIDLSCDMHVPSSILILQVNVDNGSKIIVKHFIIILTHGPITDVNSPRNKGREKLKCLCLSPFFLKGDSLKFPFRNLQLGVDLQRPVLELLGVDRFPTKQHICLQFSLSC